MPEELCIYPHCIWTREKLRVWEERCKDRGVQWWGSDTRIATEYLLCARSCFMHLRYNSLKIHKTTLHVTHSKSTKSMEVCCQSWNLSQETINSLYCLGHLWCFVTTISCIHAEGQESLIWEGLGRCMRASCTASTRYFLPHFLHSKPDQLVPRSEAALFTVLFLGCQILCVEDYVPD